MFHKILFSAALAWIKWGLQCNILNKMDFFKNCLMTHIYWNYALYHTIYFTEIYCPNNMLIFFLLTIYNIHSWIYYVRNWKKLDKPWINTFFFAFVQYFTEEWRENDLRIKRKSNYKICRSNSEFRKKQSNRPPKSIKDF